MPMQGDGRLGIGREDFSPRRKARKKSVLYPVKGAVLAILAALRERISPIRADARPLSAPFEAPQKAQKAQMRFVIVVPFVANSLGDNDVGRWLLGVSHPLACL
jgi:hypothetical protein